jgi:adenosylcobyric acid synthase
MAQGDLLFYEEAAAQLLRALRGKRSQVALARRLGYREGLGLLAVDVTYLREKRTTNVRARGSAFTFLTLGLGADAEITAYEIHQGCLRGVEPGPFEIAERNGEPVRPEGAVDGAVSASGFTVGTMLHGLFENPEIRDALSNSLGQDAALRIASEPSVDAYDQLERVFRESIDVGRLWEIVGLSPQRPLP